MEVNKKENCFNLIRVIAAMQVFLGHASAHLDVPLSPIYIVLSGPVEGVPIFFIISGFLIWYSLEKTTNFKTYAAKRVFRLYPELWGGVFWSIVSLLLLYRTNIKWKAIIAWIFTQGTIFQFWTPDCLREFGCGTPNGSLWTIGVMVQSYIVIWLLHKHLHKKTIKRWEVFLIMGVGISLITPKLENVLPAIVYKLYNQTFLPYIWIFILGAFICEYFESMIDLLQRKWYVFYAISAIVTITGFDVRGSYAILKVLFLTPALIGFAYRFPSFKIKWDLSYGFYIYHMIVINVMIELHYTGKIYNILFAAIISAIMATISYLTIGSFSRRMKKIL